jgi:glutathione S-transferase
MKLYWHPQTRAIRPRWLLEELGVPYELVPVDLTKDDPEYLKIHPLGAVPALEHDGVVIHESLGICAWLADLYPEKGLAPPVGSPERALYCQWLFFGPGTFEPAIVDVLAAKENPERLEKARRRLRKVAGVVERGVGEGPWLLGARFTAADIALGGMVVWAKLMGLLDGSPGLDAYAERLAARPANQRAWSD